MLSILVLSIYMYGIEKLGGRLRAKDPGAKLVGIPVAIMFVMMILLLPAVVGETAGKDVAAKELVRFATGCDSGRSAASVRCSQIVMDGKVLVTGYIIDASQSHVAVFDPATRRTTVAETAGKTITSWEASIPVD